MTAQSAQLLQIHDLQESINETAEQRSKEQAEAEKLEELAEYSSVAELYDEVRQFLYDHVDLLEEIYYDLLTAWVFTTWRVDDTKECAYLLFSGVPSSGKSRSMETLNEICYNGLNAAQITTPALYRILTKEPTTLFIDNFERLNGDRLDKILTILNSGYTRGAQIIMVNKDKHDEIQYFECYGPKAVGTTKNVDAAFKSRCIMIPMIKNTRIINDRIDKKQSFRLRLKLGNYQKDMEAKEDSAVPDTFKLMAENGINDGRLKQILNAIIGATPKEKRGPLIEWAKEEYHARLQEEGLEIYGEIFTAITNEILDPARVNHILVKDIRDRINEDHAEADIMSSRQVGGLLSQMGLTKKYRTGEGIGRIITPKLLKRLEKRYKRGQQQIETF